MPEPIGTAEKSTQPPAPNGLSRREFVRQVGAGFIAVAAAGVGGVNLLSGSVLAQLALSNGVIMPDPTLCIGCLTCEVICSRVHREQGLSDVPRIRIFNYEATVPDPALLEEYGDRGHYLQSPCLMCPDAPCHYVCPADSLVVEPTTNARFIDEDKCIACGRCAEACPFPVFPESEATSGDVLGQKTRITYDPVKDTYVKCDLCYWRAEGPACVERCPVNIRIKQGIVKSDRLCLDAPAATREHWERQRALDQNV
ncbi:MAG: 4Fe-4S binding protein [Anaerolineae bacterium]